MTPLEKMNHFISPTGKLVIAMSTTDNMTQTEMRKFKKWAKRNAYSIVPTYLHESRQSAFTLCKGDISMLCINRITTEATKDNPKGHCRGDHSIITKCNVACFINSTNLGQFGIGWKDFVSGDAELLIQLRVPKQHH